MRACAHDLSDIAAGQGDKGLVQEGGAGSGVAGIFLLTKKRARSIIGNGSH